jgi:cellulose synthase (UDP-forming)
VLCQVLFLVSARGVPTWRGQQYSFALFPTWIMATVSAAANVFFGRPLPFLVTPKDQTIARREWRLVAPQLIATGVLVAAVFIGIARLLFWGADTVGTIINIAWAVYDLALISVVIRAVNVGARLSKETR